MPQKRPYNQAEAMTYLKHEQDKLRELYLVKAESEAIQFLEWASLPQTKKIREVFSKFENKVLKVFKQNKWTEAEGHGIAYLFQFTSLIEDIIAETEKQLSQLRQKQQKEG